MLPPFPCCAPAAEVGHVWRQHQERKMRMLRFWRDALERQLAAADAAISTLERQMDRDAAQPGG
jgi:hypothetical protein